MKKRFNKRTIALVLAISSLALLTGCGAASSTGVAVAPGSVLGGIVGGCVPITTTTMIGFQATGMYLGNPSAGDPRVLAGIIPPGDPLATGTYGTVGVTPGNFAPPVATTYGAPMTFQSQRVDGTSLTLSVTSATAAPMIPTNGYPMGYPYSMPVTGSVNATGYIQISSFVQQLMISMATGGYGNSSIFGTFPGTMPGYPTGYPGVANTQICVSNVALSLQQTNASFANWLYMGSVYFYLTGGVMNGQHGLALNF